MARRPLLDHRALTFLLSLFLASFPLFAQPTAASDGDAATPASSDNSLQQNQQGLAHIEQQLNAEKQAQKQSKLKEKHILRRLQRLDQTLNHLDQEKQNSQRDLDSTRVRLDSLKSQMGQNQAFLDENRQLLKQRLQALYRMSYHASFLQELLNSQSFGDFVRQLKFQTLLAESNEKILDETLDQEHQLEQASEDWKRQQERKQRLVSTLALKEKNYSREFDSRQKFLGSIQQQQVMREQTIAELSQAANDLQQKVKTFLVQEQQAEEKPKATWVPAGKGLKVVRGRIPWPVSGQIISFFGKYRNKELNEVQDNSGIQIAAPIGTPFHAVAAGLVRYADWFEGYGKLVILDHGRGYYSLYAHAADLNVADGQKVAAGEVLGTVGDTGSLFGSNLYFEIRKNGVPEDPLRWLKNRM